MTQQSIAHSLAEIQRSNLKKIEPQMFNYSCPTGDFTYAENRLARRLAHVLRLPFRALARVQQQPSAAAPPIVVPPAQQRNHRIT